MVGGGTLHNTKATTGTTVPTISSRSPVAHVMGVTSDTRTMQVKRHSGTSTLGLNNVDTTAFHQEGMSGIWLWERAWSFSPDS